MAVQKLTLALGELFLPADIEAATRAIRAIRGLSAVQTEQHASPTSAGGAEGYRLVVYYETTRTDDAELSAEVQAAVDAQLGFLARTTRMVKREVVEGFPSAREAAVDAAREAAKTVGEVGAGAVQSVLGEIGKNPLAALAAIVTIAGAFFYLARR